MGPRDTGGHREQRSVPRATAGATPSKLLLQSCLSYFSMAVAKHRIQGNLGNVLFGGLWFQRIRGKAAGMAEWSHLDPQIGGRETLGMVGVF